MAEHKSFTACLTRLGFDAPTRELLDDQGIHTIHDLTDFPFPEIDRMIQHLSRWKPRAADVKEDEDPVSTPTFPYRATRTFKALRSWED
jgi:hypothetical protein